MNMIIDSDNILDEAINWEKLRQWFVALKQEAKETDLEFNDDDCLETLNNIIKDECLWGNFR